MRQSVKIVFDRKKQAAKTGRGKIELYIYLSRTETKWETVGASDSDSWEVVAQNRNIQAKMKHYEQVISAMNMIGEDMTIENFNNKRLWLLEVIKSPLVSLSFEGLMLL
jgi:hypothetical protein